MRSSDESDSDQSDSVATGGDGRDLSGTLMGFAKVAIGGDMEGEEREDVGDDDTSLEASSSIMLRMVNQSELERLS